MESTHPGRWNNSFLVPTHHPGGARGGGSPPRDPHGGSSCCGGGSVVRVDHADPPSFRTTTNTQEPEEDAAMRMVQGRRRGRQVSLVPPAATAPQPQSNLVTTYQVRDLLDFIGHDPHSDRVSSSTTSAFTPITTATSAVTSSSSSNSSTSGATVQSTTAAWGSMVGDRRHRHHPTSASLSPGQATEDDDYAGEDGDEGDCAGATPCCRDI